jgi:hypothetical protein
MEVEIMVKRVTAPGVACIVAGAALAGAALAAPALAAAQESRPASPAGTSATQVGGQWVKGQRGERYEGGKWIEITYGRPIRKGRSLWGSGADYGKPLLAGAPVWRAGADVSTQLKTEVPLQIGGKPIPAGTYTMFIDLKSDTDWTLIVSSWAAQTKYDSSNKAALWGAYNYTPDKDVVRVPMKVDKLPVSVDQLTWGFADVSNTGGKLVLWWDTVMASAPFSVAQ